MFELPEIATLARQMAEVLPGKVVEEGRLGNREHKFVWYNRSHEEFADLVRGRTVGVASSRGKWLFVPLEPGYVLTLGELGGRLLFHAPGEALPEAYHLLLRFTDGSALSAMTQMWGAMELYAAGEELERHYVKDMRPTPDDDAFTPEHFEALVAEAGGGRKRTVKGLLVLDQLVPGLGNAIAQDIMFAAHLDPRHPVTELSVEQRHVLYDAIRATVRAAIAAGGRDDELDLFGRPGGYERVMDRRALGGPCPRCGAIIVKIQYLGGACYVCPGCQDSTPGAGHRPDGKAAHLPVRGA
jgi:formamidopyrimidine-DNA glycosylase